MDQKQVANAYLRIPIDGGCALACPAVIDQGPTRTNENLDADEVIHLVCKDLIDIHHMVHGNCHPWIRAKISKFLELYALFLIIMSQYAPIPMDKIKHIP